MEARESDCPGSRSAMVFGFLRQYTVLRAAAKVGELMLCQSTVGGRLFLCLSRNSGRDRRYSVAGIAE
jgi:hypothetical protein